MPGQKSEIHEIEERLSNIEARISLIIDFISDAATKLDKNSNSFSLYALITGITAQELNEIESLFRDASIEDNINLSKFKVKFKKRLPRIKNSLNSIANGFLAEGKFPYLCDKILHK